MVSSTGTEAQGKPGQNLPVLHHVPRSPFLQSAHPAHQQTHPLCVSPTPSPLCWSGICPPNLPTVETERAVKTTGWCSSLGQNSSVAVSYPSNKNQIPYPHAFVFFVCVNWYLIFLQLITYPHPFYHNREGYGTSLTPLIKPSLSRSRGLCISFSPYAEWPPR